jgi:hypothetical protein
MSKGIAFLMYHELESQSRTLCEKSVGYTRYVVNEKDFRAQLSMIVSDGWDGWNVTQALRVLSSGDVNKKGICLTFDDGCLTDLSVAAPLLLQQRLSATFYVTVNHLGKRGYMTQTQVRELAKLGFEIGSHSMSHRHLNDLKFNDLKMELTDSKKQLEDITGHEVVHFSCPGGRTSELIEKIAREANYHSVATSRIGLNTPKSDNYALARIAVKKNIKTESLAKLCRGERLFFSQVQSIGLSAAKRVLGNSIYERVRARALR